MRNICILLFICSQSYSFAQDYFKLKKKLGNIDTSYMLKVIDIYPHFSDMRQSERLKHKKFDPIYCYVKCEHNNRAIMLSYDKFNDEAYLFLTNRINSVYDSLDVITKREHLQLMRQIEVRDSLFAIELKKTKQRDSIQKARDKIIIAQQNAEKAKKAEEKKNELIKRWGEGIYYKIQRREIWIGMSDEQLRLSWGRPERISESVGSWGIHETYIYPSYKYVFLKNGEVTSWNISK